MKSISEIDKLGPVKPQAPGETSGETGDGELFKNALEKAMDTSRTAQSVEGSESSLPPLGEIQTVHFQGVTDDTAGGIEQQADRMLNLFDAYTRALDDPKQSLKDIEPLLNDMKAEADLFSQMIETGRYDERMKTLAEQSSLLARVEYIKFQRGDYVE